MESLLATTVPIKPAFPYFDKVAAWLREPADRATLAELEYQCGYLKPRNQGARFDLNFRQRLEFKQPKPGVLRWLAERPDAYINQVEVTLDFVFDSPAERNRAYEFFDQHLVRKWHGKRQEIRVLSVPAETRYDAGRHAPNATALYKPDSDRFTGEPDRDGILLHLDWRAQNGRAVRAVGIESGRNLVEFNHRQFWEKRLCLYEVDPERLGRWLRKRGRKGRGRQSPLEDLKTGEFVIKSVNYRVQALIDRYGSLVRRALQPIPIEAFLPR